MESRKRKREGVLARILGEYGFAVSDHALTFRGRCAECRDHHRFGRWSKTPCGPLGAKELRRFPEQSNLVQVS